MQIQDFKLEHFFARWEFVAPYMLGSSDSETHSLTELLALADDECRTWWESLRLGYTEVPGHPLLRGAIASLYESVEPDEIVVFAGAQEAIFAFMNVVLESHDHALVPWPGYQSLYEVARAVGADVTLVPLRPEERWHLDLNAVEASLRSNTRLIAVNFPHSPTGSHVDGAEWRQLVEIARSRQAYLFSDEVYRFGEYRDAERVPAAADVYEQGISLGVMSKSFGLAGLRIGWIACRDRRLLDRIQAFKHYLTICNSAPAEVLATIALRRAETILTRNREIALANLQRLDVFFERWADLFEWVRPRAGTTAFPRLALEIPIDEFVVDLAQSEGVLLLPGTVFDHPGNHFRIGIGRRNFPTALERLERFCESRVGVRRATTS